MYQLDMGIILDAMRDLQIQQKMSGQGRPVQKTCPDCRAPATISSGHEKVWTTFSAEGQTSRFILPDVCINLCRHNSDNVLLLYGWHIFIPNITHIEKVSDSECSLHLSGN